MSASIDSVLLLEMLSQLHPLLPLVIQTFLMFVIIGRNMRLISNPAKHWTQLENAYCNWKHKFMNNSLGPHTSAMSLWKESTLRPLKAKWQTEPCNHEMPCDAWAVNFTMAQLRMGTQKWQRIWTEMKLFDLNRLNQRMDKSNDDRIRIFQFHMISYWKAKGQTKERFF